MFEISLLFYGVFAVLVLGVIVGLIGSARSRRDINLLPARDRGRLAFNLPFRGLTRAQFNSTQDQGNYGEALTVMVMTARGYRVMNGKTAGPQGIDGIFITDGPSGWQAVLVETKTGQSQYKDRQMSDEKLLSDLDTLYVTSGDEQERNAYAAIAEGLRTQAAHVVKELWRHDLEAGLCLAVTLDSSGARLGRARSMTVAGVREGLAAAARLIDRHSAYQSQE